MARDATCSLREFRRQDEKAEQLIEDLLCVLGEYETDFLRHAAEQAELVNPDGWLGKMLREYLSVWR